MFKPDRFSFSQKSHLSRTPPVPLTLGWPRSWVCTHFKIFGSITSPSYPVGDLLTTVLVDVMGNVVCMASQTYCESSLCSPYF